MASLQPTGHAALLPTNVMSMKEIVTLIVTALEVLYAEATIAGQLDYLEVIGSVLPIAA